MALSAYLNFWGRDQLQRWPEGSVRATSLPEPSKAFLIEVGMPPSLANVAVKRFEYLHYFTWNLALPAFRGRPSRRIIAAYGDLPIVIDELRNGCVIRTELEPNGNGLPGAPEALWNTSVEQFALSLTEDHKKSWAMWPYVDPHKESRNLAEEQAKDKINIDMFESRLLAIDPAALGDAQSAWAYKIFQVRCEVDEEYYNPRTH